MEPKILCRLVCVAFTRQGKVKCGTALLHDMAALHAIIISHHLNEQTDMVYVCVPVSIMYPVATVAALHALLAYLFILATDTMSISIIFYVNQILRTQNTYERSDVAMLFGQKNTILTRRVAIKITFDHNLDTSSSGHLRIAAINGAAICLEK